MNQITEALNKCTNCSKAYDETTIPLVLPCGHNYCEGCLTASYSNQKKLICFSENKTFETELTIKNLNAPIQFTEMLIKIIQGTPNISYMCSKHKKRTIDFVCDEHQEFICSLCMWDHANHKESTRIYLKEIYLKTSKRLK